MEERIIDKDKTRTIRLKMTEDGKLDAEDPFAEEAKTQAPDSDMGAANAPEGEASSDMPPAEEGEGEAEYVITMPDEELDESLIGLPPELLEKELARRKKAEEAARKECAELVEKAEELVEKGEYQKAEPLYSQAMYYSFADEKIANGLWISRTKNFTDDTPFYSEINAEEFSSLPPSTKEFVRGKVKDRLEESFEALSKEEAELAPGVLARQEERRKAFQDNKQYFTFRFLICFAVMALLLIGTGVSAAYIYRLEGSLAVILTGVFGGAAFITFVVVLVYLRKSMLAARLCRTNAKLSSTEEGERLTVLRSKIYCLNLILNDEEEGEEIPSQEEKEGEAPAAQEEDEEGEAGEATNTDEKDE